MIAARESIKKGLMSLIARKDASVFQSLDNFTREINHLGDWQGLPEISALAAGLAERLPWELQKDGSGLVSRRSIINLAGLINKKHSVSEELAIWAVEAWAFSLGLKFEPTTKPAKMPTSPASTGKTNNQPAPANIPTTQRESSTNAYSGLIAKSRLGLIFGQDEAGTIRVFASWFRDENAKHTTGLTATMLKIETVSERPLFSAPPPRRKRSGMATPETPQEHSSKENTEVSTAAPALTKEISQHKSAIKPAPATKTAEKEKTPPPPRTVSKPASSAKPVPQAVSKPVRKNQVYYGSAESLYNQAVKLLPGHTSKPDIVEALAILNQSAKQGSLDAKRAIGIIYLKGIGIKQDFTTAANWLRLAADAGDAESQFHLGSLYQCGMGVEFSLEKAQSLLQRAAKQGHKEAQTLLNEILQS